MTIQFFISGKWKGYFVDNRYSAGGPANNKWYMDINMAFGNNHQFTATGSDEVGDFNFEDGKITDGKVTFRKACNSHNVYYEGEIKGTKLEGQWWLEDVPSIKGDWAMWPATSADI